MLLLHAIPFAAHFSTHTKSPPNYFSNGSTLLRTQCFYVKFHGFLFISPLPVLSFN